MSDQEATFQNSRVALVEGPRFADCKFISAWLSSVADLQARWRVVLEDREFRRRIERVLFFYEPNFEESAFALLVELGKEQVTFSIDLENEGAQEFAMMVRLGFFSLTRDRYQMTIPSDLSIRQVEKAALAVEATEDDQYFLHLDKLIVTIPLSEAKDWQHKLLHMDQGEREAKLLVSVRR